MPETRAICPKQITTFLRLLFRPGEVFEVRVLDAERSGGGRPRNESGYFDYEHIDEVPKVLAGVRRAAGVYVTINPTDPALLARVAYRLRVSRRGETTSDTEVACRRTFLIDIDPARPAGICATDAEKELAFQKAMEVCERRTAAGWPLPVVIDSGNGFHLVYLIDLPADDDGLIRRCLQALQAESTDQVHIDVSVSNASRISRIPGTWNCKGDDMPDRPHRMSEILEAPETPQIVPVALLEALAVTLAPSSERPHTAPRTPVSAPGDRPGDDYNQRGELATLLKAHGWQHLGDSGDNQLWRRPGKTTGNHSATFDGRTFFVFSSAAAPFEANTGYSPFAAYAMLEHGGDHAQAARKLADQGYGELPVTEYPDVDLSVLLENLLGPGDPILPSTEPNTTVCGKPLPELVSPPCPDPNELLRYRFLCRGGGLLLAAPSGIGKSTWAIQSAILWAGGWDMCGVAAAGPMRISVIQAENDEGDLAEMRDGVLRGLAHEHSSEALEAAAGRVTVHTEASHAGTAFVGFLEQVIIADEPDMVIVDPVYSFLGADVSDQAAVSVWLRNGITPVIQAHRVGLFLVHHSNKPKATDTATYRSVGDLSYAASGSNEWANWPRAILVIQRTDRDGYFRLAAPKRGGRLNWRNEEGTTCERPIAYSRQAGLMYWREPAPSELVEAPQVAPGVGGPQSRASTPPVTAGDIAESVLPWLDGQGKAVLLATLREHICKTYQVGRDKAREAIRLLVDDHGLVKTRAQAGCQRVDAIGHPRQAQALADQVVAARMASTEENE